VSPHRLLPNDPAPLAIGGTPKVYEAQPLGDPAGKCPEKEFSPPVGGRGFLNRRQRACGRPGLYYRIATPISQPMPPGDREQDQQNEPSALLRGGSAGGPSDDCAAVSGPREYATSVVVQ
jgi:hypothetical protein